LIESCLGDLIELAPDPTLADWDLVEALRARGAEPTRAMRLVALAPIAFGRAQLNGRPVTFSPLFEVRGERTHSWKPRRRVSVPEFVAAQSAAERLGPSHPAFVALANRSAEVRVVDELQHGDPEAEVVLTEALAFHRHRRRRDQALAA
jgi:hypothetical protein